MQHQEAVTDCQTQPKPRQKYTSNLRDNREDIALLWRDPTVTGGDIAKRYNTSRSATVAFCIRNFGTRIKVGEDGFLKPPTLISKPAPKLKPVQKPKAQPKPRKEPKFEYAKDEDLSNFTEPKCLSNHKGCKFSVGDTIPFRWCNNDADFNGTWCYHHALRIFPKLKKLEEINGRN